MKKIFQIILFILILGISFLYYSYNNFKNDILITENKIIEIKDGETIKNLAEELNINYYFLKKYIENKEKKSPLLGGDLEGGDFNLLAGRFEIKENSNIEDILKSLETPLPDKQVELTILEGWNIYDIDDYLTNKGYINSGDYIDYVNNPEKIKALTEFYDFINTDFISLEGYLYPDTYSLKFPLKVNEVIIKQLDNFEEKVYNILFKEKNLNNENIYDVINLASIVEKEEKNPVEKSTVAGILKKRLNADWNIGADITVCYHYELTADECKMVVSKYINEKSDYNTRTMTGLPKTPIGNPSYETINATLNDKETSYWFYLHNVKTGEIHYAETNAEHEENKKYMY